MGRGSETVDKMCAIGFSVIGFLLGCMVTSLVWSAWYRNLESEHYKTQTELVEVEGNLNYFIQTGELNE